MYRSIRARSLLQLLLVSAVTSLLLVRLYLHLADYPQIGGGGLHIAHVLWGGLLMLAALAINLAFIGKRSQQSAAVVGGAGFGVFIDELGKFITKDNNYFYEPTIGIIYAIFILLFLTFNFLSRKQLLSSREYQINTLSQLEEAVANDMDPREKNQTRKLLEKADKRDAFTHQLFHLLDKVDTIKQRPPRFFRRFLHRIDAQYSRFWRQRRSNTLVRVFFIVETLVFLAAIISITAPNIQDLISLFDRQAIQSLALVIGELSSLIVAASFTLFGVALLRKSRLLAFEQFRRAALVNIFFTSFFMFSRVQFEALPNFFFNLLLLGCVTYAMHHEQRLKD